MLIEFKLSMPNNNAWNGKWSGEGNYYAIIKNIRSKDIAERILEGRYYNYNFGDGWAACVTARQVTSDESRKLRKRTKGFCGYDWMIKSIITDGKIVASQPHKDTQ